MSRSAISQRRRAIRNIANSLYFDGVNDDVNCGNNVGKERTDAFSFSFWCKPISYGTAASILGKRTGGNAGYNLFYLDSAVAPFHALRLYFDSANNTQLGVNSPPIARDRWTHVVTTYDGSSTAAGIKFYFNGVIQATTTAVDTGLNSSITNAVSFIMGVKADNLSDYKGNLTEVRVHDVELTQAQVDDLFYDGIAADVEHEWLFTEGSGGTLADSVGSANGTIDATWSVDSPLTDRSAISQARGAISTNRSAVS